MDTQIEVKSKAVELKDKITAHIEELARLTDSARLSESMVAYLEAASKFHNYSMTNTWLIILARPDSTYVAGFNKWKELGRWVRKGEKGIPILAPIFTKTINDKGEEENELTGFLTVHVFDVSQTEGRPLPEPPDWTSPQMDAVLQEKLMLLTTSRGIKVKLQSLPNNVQGASLGGLILLSPLAGTKTLVHELAHELLHQQDDSPKDKTIRELEAESVAFVVGKHFGLEGLASPNYIALHGANGEMILSYMQRVTKVASEIITG